jgi:hypothetical protein
MDRFNIVIGNISSQHRLEKEKENSGVIHPRVPHALIAVLHKGATAPEALQVSRRWRPLAAYDNH